MRIYDLHNQHAEWLDDPTGHQTEIRDAVHAYISELFKMGADVRNKVLFKDLDKIASNRSKIKKHIGILVNQKPEHEALTPDTTNADELRQNEAKCKILEWIFDYVVRYLKFYGYAVDGNEVEKLYRVHGDITNSYEWLTDDDLRHKSALEDFNNIILDDDSGREKDYVNITNQTAKELYKELSNKKIIVDCKEEDFLWYFGEDEHRARRKKPDKIKWNERTNAFVCLCYLINMRKCSIEGDTQGIAWKIFCSIFEDFKNKKEWKEIHLAAEKSKMKSGKAGRPKDFYISTLKAEMEKLINNAAPPKFEKFK